MATSTQHNLFLLPNGVPASFHLHNFQNQQLSKKLKVSFPPFLSSLSLTPSQRHGGRITDNADAADVILTTSRDEYKSLKDRYAVSPRTYVRLSGFVDRCIHSRRFQLAPLVKTGVPGRKLGSR
jgi:hypothetical protein